MTSVGVVSSTGAAASYDNTLRMEATEQGTFDYTVTFEDWIGAHRWVDSTGHGSVHYDEDDPQSSMVTVKGKVSDDNWFDDETYDELQFEHAPDVADARGDSGVAVYYNGVRYL